ncbi:hypothetical protein V2J09_016553 [Rumex salicifolius]
MAEDIDQLLLEAQHRWLRPTEICQILQNYRNFRIAPEPQHLPQSINFCLINMPIAKITRAIIHQKPDLIDVLRYFRKDGHNWRKKKDGKTIKEAHEKLKASNCN